MVATGLAVAVAALALLSTAGVGVLAVRGRVDTAEALVSASGRTDEATTALSVVASVMGVWILLSPAEAGAAFGGLPAVLGYAVGSAVPLLLFIPVGRRVRRLMPAGHSLSEYVLARFGSRFYGFVLVVSVFYMVTFLAAEMTGVALALSLVGGVPPWLTACTVALLALSYTAYGGLPASLATDAVQTLLLLPLLVVGFAGAVFALGGVDQIYASVAASDPAALSLTNPVGVEFGLYVGFAVLGANMLHQGLWQRVWAADTTASVRRGFTVAAIAIVPMVFLAGLFGVAAVGLGVAAESPSVALFAVLQVAFPPWVSLAVVAIAVLLVTSTADTILNAVASLVTVDAARVLDDPSDARLKRLARVLTVVVAVVTGFVGAQGYNVLTMFLLADLLGAAVFAPFVLGLVLPSLTESGALAAGVSGLVVGLLYFPVSRGVVAGTGLPLPQPSFLWAFVGATGVSVAVTVLAAGLSDAAFDLESLRGAAVRFDGGEQS